MTKVRDGTKFEWVCSSLSVDKEIKNETAVQKWTFMKLVSRV